jgi:predicted nucleotidyltransferase
MKQPIELKYQKCINEFTKDVIKQLKQNIQVIILHGGLVRDTSPIEFWSDIDLILIFKQYSYIITQYLAKTVGLFESRYNLRLDINVIYQYDFDNEFNKSKYYNSEIINALHKRNVKILYGNLDIINLQSFNENEAVYVYLNNTQNLFRRYYVENIYRNLDSNNCGMYLQRIIRWVFSIIRSSLRLSNIYVNPYQDSLNELIRLEYLSNKEIQLIEKLIQIRTNFSELDTSNIEYFIGLFSNIECFIESFINRTIIHNAKKQLLE